MKRQAGRGKNEHRSLVASRIATEKYAYMFITLLSKENRREEKRERYKGHFQAVTSHRTKYFYKAYTTILHVFVCPGI